MHTYMDSGIGSVLCLSLSLSIKSFHEVNLQNQLETGS